MNNEEAKQTPPSTPQPESPQGQAPAAEENVVFQQGNNNAIPEEYLTDEDLYPASSSGNGNLASTVKKKTPLILIGVVGFFVFILLIIILVKLFGGRDQTTEKAKLTFWGVWQAPQVMDQIIKEYQTQHPEVEIEYTEMDPKDNYRERVIERTRNGTGPDIFRYHNTWAPGLKEILAAAPNTVTTADDFGNTYYSVMMKDLVQDGQVVGYPYNLDGLVLIYNDTLLKDAGVQTPPQDWESLIEVSKQVTVKDTAGNMITAGIALGSAENVSHFSDIIAMMFLQNAVDLKSLEGSINAQTVLETYTNFVVSGNTNVWSENMGNSLNAFAEEKVAMIFAPIWEVEVLKHLNPDLVLKVTQVPQIRGGNEKNIANYWADGVSKGSKYQAQAWQFLKYLSEKETQAKMFELEVKSGRLFGNVYPRKDMAELLLDNEYLSPLLKDANILDSMPLISRTYDNGVNDSMVNDYLKDIINGILLNGSATTESLTLLNKGVLEVLPKYGY